MRKLLFILSVCGLFALSSMVFYPMSDTLAKGKQNRNKGLRKIGAERQRIDGAIYCFPHLGGDVCMDAEGFMDQGEDVWLKGGRKFKGNADGTVPILVVPSKAWSRTLGEPIPQDVTGHDSNGNPIHDPTYVPVKGNGRISNNLIWERPLTIGTYDIVADTDHDGVLSPNDSIRFKCINVVDANEPFVMEDIDGEIEPMPTGDHFEAIIEITNYTVNGIRGTAEISFYDASMGGLSGHILLNTYVVEAVIPAKSMAIIDFLEPIPPSVPVESICEYAVTVRICDGPAGCLTPIKDGFAYIAPGEGVVEGTCGN